VDSKIGVSSVTAVRTPLRAIARTLAAIAMVALVGCGASPPPPQPALPAPPAPTVTQAAGDGEQRIAELGVCALDSGERIDDCRIGYRTFGKLDATKSNAVLFPTWFTGTTKRLLDSVPDKLVDTKRFFLILVDAIGDGVSSSPSNSPKQARLAFPRFTIHDMVETQRRLLREVLGVERLHAVMGISMGGMQAFEWSVAHPDEVARAVPIVGTPQLTSHDLHLWNTELHALEDSVAYAGGNYQGRPKIRAVQDIHWLMLTTPRHRARDTSRDAYAKWAEDKEADTAFDWNDWHRQAEAMLKHDIARAHGGSLEAVAKTVKAKMLVVVADQDHMVHPEPAKAFAKAMGDRADLVVLDTDCGHFAPGCASAEVNERVKKFLAN
jgi:homoserine O-acetyltransferase/O-succinyltransferase